MKIALVFRSGGDFSASDVQWLANQIPPGYEIICLTDVKNMLIPGVTCIPLIHKWNFCRGWWAKIELFRPDIEDDLFFLDLDTVITGDITPILDAPPAEFTMLRDFYHPRRFGSGVMWIPNTVKAKIWSAFWRDSSGWITSCTTTEYWGDQGFLRKVMGDGIATFQDLYPGWFKSYKVDVAMPGSKYANPRYSRGNGRLPADCRIVSFHGRPRPQQVTEPWIPGAQPVDGLIHECESD
ncbi:phosphohydrolase [Salmonella enterica]|nr:phosphohydrolase [Salmonella enterica]